MARKKTGVSTKDSQVKTSKHVNVSSKDNASKPKHRNHTKTVLNQSQQPSKLRMASQDTREVNSRPVKRQKSNADAGATSSFDSISASEHGGPDAMTSAKQQKTDDATTITTPKKEHSVISGGEHEQKHDSNADNKYEGLRIDSTANTKQQSSGATPDSKLQSSIARVLDPEAQHLQDEYRITFMSILSSSQVGNKISNLMLSAVQPELKEDGTKGLAGVVVASAKGSVISKLVTIVERFMRATNEGGDTYYVYYSLKGAKQEKKWKPGKGGKTLHGRKQDDVATGSTISEDTKKGTAREDNQYVPDDTDEPAFETMGRHQIMEKEQNPKKIHVVPQMTTYISRVPLPGLKAFSPFVILPRKKQINKLTSYSGNKLTLSPRADPENCEVVTKLDCFHIGSSNPNAYVS